MNAVAKYLQSRASVFYEWITTIMSSLSSDTEFHCELQAPNCAIVRKCFFFARKMISRLWYIMPPIDTTYKQLCHTRCIYGALSDFNWSKFLKLFFIFHHPNPFRTLKRESESEQILMRFIHAPYAKIVRDFIYGGSCLLQQPWKSSSLFYVWQFLRCAYSFGCYICILL